MNDSDDDEDYQKLTRKQMNFIQRLGVKDLLKPDPTKNSPLTKMQYMNSGINLSSHNTQL